MDSQFSFRSDFHSQCSSSCLGLLFVIFVFPLIAGYERKVDQNILSPWVPKIAGSSLLRFGHDPGSSRYLVRTFTYANHLKRIVVCRVNRCWFSAKCLRVVLHFEYKFRTRIGSTDNVIIFSLFHHVNLPSSKN